MSTLVVALLSFFGFIAAYHTYGKWLARRVFGLDKNALVPSRELRDDVDYIPTKKQVIFGHHFTSIAGTGPIVGPAIAVFWGWLPALLWVVFGSIFIGAVHDFGALVVSLRNRGQTLGEVAGRMINKRAKILFLLILFFALTIVLAIFGLVIAIIFANYPETVLSVWIEIPLAVAIGFWVYKKGGGLLFPSLAALAIMYGCIYIGAYHFQIDISVWFGIPLVGKTLLNAVVVWSMVLFVYCFIASVLPVWTLLQPRDYINSHELILALGLLVLGLVVAGVTGKADLATSAPAINQEAPADAPPIWPFLFITIACGACSGFHCLVSSGTSSKQVASEVDAQYVAYGAMLLEGALAVIVIIACCAGVGMGKFSRDKLDGGGYAYQPKTVDGKQLTGRAAWLSLYANPMTVMKDGKEVTVGGWNSFKLTDQIGGFIEGGANFISVLGIPLKLSIGIVAVLVASFAATTLDTATRLQRYVIQELAIQFNFKPLENKYAATGLAILLGGAVALTPGALGPGSGGLILWPLFGATNQLLAGLAFLVICFYLIRRNLPVWFAAIPMFIMLIMPAWAMLYNMKSWMSPKPNFLLLAFGLVIMSLQVWIVVEGLLTLKTARGNYPELEPLPALAGGGTVEEG
ncbi:MAG: carbon starvation protein A [Planctomycetota bacterium]|nr:carbon starvation protein A [Planctomycetota bacterium]MDA1141439.1 carbon starvation protein A [Planctomycetota bacterium]